MEIAAGLGADVPFFLFGGRALGTSRGDEIYPLPDLAARAVLVVSPREIAVSTRDAYAWLGRAIDKGPAVSRLWSFCALCWSTQEAGLSNDFEGAVFRRHPRLGIYPAGTARAWSNGSGAGG